MNEAELGDIFNGLNIPVVVCRNAGAMPVAFANAEAKLVFEPAASVTRIRRDDVRVPLAEFARFRSGELFDLFQNELRNSGSVAPMDVEILSYQGDVLPARVHANIGAVAGEEYAFIYFSMLPAMPAADSPDSFLATILNASHHASGIDEALQTVLGLTGEYAALARVTIFEDAAGALAGITHEWLAKDVPPLRRAAAAGEYAFSCVMDEAGMVVCDDTVQLPDADRAVLEGHGVGAIVVVPLFHRGKPLGYIAFDHCGGSRRWGVAEIQLLKNVASVVSSLINRRNAERESARSLEVVQTVTDNLDDLVYITDMETRELKFISKSLSRAVRKSPEEIVGMSCWSVLHRNQTGPCPFCPIPRLKERVARGESGSYVWELHNSVNGKWYMVKDSIVRWIDGRDAHLGTFVDITYRKQYEEQLKRFAATDAMTDVYNRKWGAGKLEELYRVPRDQRPLMTLCFIDIDGLKLVNDTLGHGMGDEMIVNTIRTIFSCIRKDDFISRWGGDEFILLLNCGLTDAVKVMDKIAFGMEHFNSTRNKPYRLSISYGLVDFSAPFERLEDLIDDADKRMYEHKLLRRGEAGGDGMVVSVVE